jgi:hypothetical protein
MIPQQETQRQLQLINRITEISSCDLFGHLFTLHPRLVSRLRNIEHRSMALMNDLLRHDFMEDVSAASEMVIHKSELDQSLATCFGSNSRFWGHYYAHKNKRLEDQDFLSAMENASAEWICTEAAGRYRAFFTSLDALHYSSGQEQTAYALIGLALQRCLSGHLLDLLARPEEARSEYQTSLQLLGPVNADRYRRLIGQILTSPGEIISENFKTP